MPRETTNRVTLTGKIKSPFVFSHEAYGQKFFKSVLIVERKSGAIDEIDLLISDATTDVEKDYTDQLFMIHGVLKSHIETENGKNHLHHAVYVRSFTPGPKKERVANALINNIHLEGYISRNPVARETSKEKKVTDLFIAVHTSDSSSDYIPCICWNDVAEKAGKYEIGDLVKLSGRLQSREYKMKGTENTIRRIMEVSIFSIENLGKEESAGQSDK